MAAVTARTTASSSTLPAIGKSIANGSLWRNRVRRRALERLELLAGKPARAVLRGRGGGNVTSLPGANRVKLSAGLNSLAFLDALSHGVCAADRRETAVTPYGYRNRKGILSRFTAPPSIVGRPCRPRGVQVHDTPAYRRAWDTPERPVASWRKLPRPVHPDTRHDLHRKRQDSERTQALARIGLSFPGFDRAYATCSTAHTSSHRSWNRQR